jgi:tripartite ATP-independent transporter DctP family solute receptor
MNRSHDASRRRVIARFGSMAAASALATPWIQARAQGAKVIKLAHHLSLQSEQHRAAEKFGELVARYSGGALSVRVLPSAQAGGQREAIESVSLGALEMAYGESGIYSNSVSRFGVIALPYMYRDINHWQAVVDGPVGEGLAGELLKTSGLRIMNWMIGGFRDTYLRNKPIRKPEDFAGVKIRLPEAPVFVRTFRALGAQPTPIPAPEMYSALQTGVVDAMEGSPETAFTFKIFEVTKHLSRTRHILLDGSFAMNGKFYDGLAKDQQQALDKAAHETALAQRKEHFEREAGWVDKLKAGGKLEVNDVDLAAFAAKLRPLQDEFAAASKASDVVSRIKAL